MFKPFANKPAETFEIVVALSGAPLGTPFSGAPLGAPISGVQPTALPMTPSSGPQAPLEPDSGSLSSDSSGEIGLGSTAAGASLGSVMNGHSVTVAFSGECSVLEAALVSGVEIPHSCGGMGSCGTCRVWILEGHDRIGPREEVELEMAEARGFRDHERLSCQISACAGLKLLVPAPQS